MLTIRRPSYTGHHNDLKKGKSQRQTSGYEDAVLKAYGIVPVYKYSSNTQEESDADLKPDQKRGEASDSSVTQKNEKTSQKSRGNKSINDKLTRNPFEYVQARTAAQSRMIKYAGDVLKAYGLFSTQDMFS